MNNIQFPALGIDITINRIAFTIFGLDVYWYGIILTTALVTAMLIAFKLSERYDIDTDKLIDVFMVSGIIGIIGARIYYVMFAPFEYDSFWDMINIRDGGIGIYGGVIGGVAAGALMCKIKKLDTLNVLDVTAVGLLLGQSIGRWGNFVNQEAFGTNTDSIFGMISESTTRYLLSMQDWLLNFGVTVDPYAPVHPTFLYESVWCLIGFVLLLFYLDKRKFKGQVFTLALIWYGIGRYFIEGLRTDSLATGAGIRTSQVVALVTIVVSVVINIYVLTKKKPNVEIVTSQETKTTQEETDGQ